jgi:hypothetical protein
MSEGARICAQLLEKLHFTFKHFKCVSEQRGELSAIHYLNLIGIKLCDDMKLVLIIYSKTVFH